MALIGIFTPTADGFTGHIKTLLLDIEATLTPPIDASHDNAPDYRVTLGKGADGAVIGFARNRKTEEGRAFISFVMDDPTLATPIYAVLFPTNNPNKTHHLYWARAGRKDDKA